VPRHWRAVVPAFVLGPALPSHCAAQHRERQRLRIVAFALPMPIFFLKGGMSASLSALGGGNLVLLVVTKLIQESAAAYPLARRTLAPPCAVSLGSTADRVANHAQLPVLIGR